MIDSSQQSGRTITTLIILSRNSFASNSDDRNTQEISNLGAKLNGQAQQAMDLLLGTHQSAQAINVKREPEDLRKEPKNPRNQKGPIYETRHPAKPQTDPGDDDDGAHSDYGDSGA
uniref:Uncharacterized protein n=1 Tax=Anopheles farauti TaxID=69004 RepID=A0A182QQW0_9DIPT